ncbi:tRNA modification GTPase MnmE [Bacteroides sp. CAG:545]|nr:tRNA modification GTPase MnmE [Bacteroides sp. CAG:545]
MTNYQFTGGTICAPATIPGTGAISIIRVSGKESLAIADKVIDTKGVPIAETEGYRLRYGTVFEADGSVLDNVIVSVFRAPHSYTGENSVEISCHASRFIVNKILELLVNAGARIAAPGEFTRRAFVNGKMDLAQAEAVADVIASQSAASHRVAMNQLKGGFSSELKVLREKLLTMTSLLELELDFSEEDVEFASRKELGQLVDDSLTHIRRLTASFSRGNAIKNGVPVAIVGATNTGKSTLLNALLGEERAIVSDIAGTTRDTIEETLNIDGILFRFIDTAGIRETDETIEKIGIDRTFKKLGEAAVVLGMTDLSRGEAAVLEDADFILSKVNEMGGVKNVGSVIDGAETGGTSPAGTDGASLAETGGAPLSETGGAPIAGTNGASLAETGGTPLAGTDRTSLAETGGTPPAETGGTPQAETGGAPLAGTDGASLAETGGASQHGHGDGQERKVVILVNKCDVAGSFYKDDNGTGYGSGNDLGKNMAEISDNKNVNHNNNIVSLIENKYDNCKVIPISAKTGKGLSTLTKTLGEIGSEITGSTDETIVTNVRHYEALVRAASALDRVRAGLHIATLPPDLIAQDLREALYHLGEIVGEITTDETLGNIFRNFCIGK